MEAKAAYRAKVEAQLEQAQARLDQMKASVKERMADAAIGMAEQVDELERGVAEAKSRLAEIAHVHEDKWEDFKASMEGAWERVTSRFAKVDRSADDDGSNATTRATAPPRPPEAVRD